MTEFKLYKYWFFYIKPEYLDLVCTEYKDSLLYAYTDDKELSDIFKSQRDMNKFFIMKKKINKSEVNYLAKNFQKEYLIKKNIKTKSTGIGSKIIKQELILTKTEEQLIQSSLSRVLMVDLWRCTLLNPYIFNDEYFDMLINIGFKDKFDIMGSWKNQKEEINKIRDNIKPDFLSAFIREFGFLLALKKGTD